MHSLTFIKRGLFRDLLLGIVLSVFVFVCALAWGGPFLLTGSHSVQAQQNQAQHATFTGTILRDGEQFMLRVTSGQLLHLDDARQAQPFEGKQVKVTGTLDAESHLIHVERIESAA